MGVRKLGSLASQCLDLGLGLAGPGAGGWVAKRRGPGDGAFVRVLRWRGLVAQKVPKQEILVRGEAMACD